MLATWYKDCVLWKAVYIYTYLFMAPTLLIIATYQFYSEVLLYQSEFLKRNACMYLVSTILMISGEKTTTYGITHSTHACSKLSTSFQHHIQGMNIR